MNKTFATLTLMYLLLSGTLVTSRAEDHAAHRKLLTAIKSNALDVKRDAASYLWPRVNRQVDRIVADEKKLQKELASHTDLKSQLEAVGRTVSTLRSARLNHNADRAVTAAKKLAEITADLLKKEADASPGN